MLYENKKTQTFMATKYIYLLGPFVDTNNERSSTRSETKKD